MKALSNKVVATQNQGPSVSIISETPSTEKLV